ncbi:MAG: hypothetical protein KDD78_17060, partial [Caldilineaceae bacterium]|nr:hypothetical protein [Caldilineaceae bacterium]
MFANVEWGKSKQRSLRQSVPWMVLLGALSLMLAAAGVGHAQETPNRAGIIVIFDDGRQETACVEFTEDSLPGDQLLDRT